MESVNQVRRRLRKVLFHAFYFMDEYLDKMSPWGSSMSLLVYLSKSFPNNYLLWDVSHSNALLSSFLSLTMVGNKELTNKIGELLQSAIVFVIKINLRTYFMYKTKYAKMMSINSITINLMIVIGHITNENIYILMWHRAIIVANLVKTEFITKKFF